MPGEALAVGSATLMQWQCGGGLTEVGPGG